MNYQLTNDEISSIERYQDNDFKIINTLLREGIESEIRINSRNGKDYPFMTKDLMEKSLNDIKNLYSAIIKSYVRNGSQKPNKQLYRGTKQSLIESMNNTTGSFLSATTNINQTLTFSRTFNKGSNIADDTDKAVLFINSNVPWINIENDLGGFEDEILFVPSKVQLTEANITSDKKYGKEYIANLVEMDIPEKTPEEIEQMKNQILSNTERMNEYLKYILAIKDNPNFNNNPRTLNVIKEYEDWKKLVVEYNHQQYRIIKNKLIGVPVLHQNNEQLSELSPKVEQEHLIEISINPKKEELYSLKKKIGQMKQENKEFLDLESIFDGIDKEDNLDSENIENVEHTGRRMM